MSNVEELNAAITAKGDEIRALKASKPPTLKEDLVPLLAQLAALKVSLSELTGIPLEVKQEKKKEEKPQVKPERKEKKASKPAAEAPKPAAVTDAESEDPFFGDSPLIQSAFMTDKVYRQINDLNERYVGQVVWLRGRLHTSRAVGKGVFIVLRQQMNTVQGVAFKSETISKAMIKYIAGISMESIVDVKALITVPEIPVQSVTIKGLELQLQEVHVITRAQELPFIVEDAGRNEEEAAVTGMPTVLPDNALNFRWIDTRTPANQGIFRIQSGVCQLFREFLLNKHFVEIHTPKLIGGASEGGSNVFTLKYFDQPACLAQSPQLYKQMVAACGGFDRVFEIGPVFRAENSNTHRHLCEFTGLDFEMAIYEHYYEALDVMGELFAFIFDGIAERFHHELVVISQQYPFEPLKYLRPALRITFKEGIDMLREAGVNASYDEDIGTTDEKALGKLVREKYGTDFYIMDKYPMSARPFYTMPDPHDPNLSNSYDLFIRGEEIVSGAQRIHDVDLLIERATAKGVPIPSIQSYIDAFKHGALPHAGGGIGLERVVMLYLGLKNIRKSSMFPRDPSRLFP